MNGERASDILSVRETAKLLGVHENTVRNWAKTGVLPDARVPGTKFFRFRRSDVERLRDNRGASAVSLKAERQIVGPELINASQLAIWANTVASRPVFPELIRRLLAATPGVTAIDIRAGDGVDLAGWDGSAESDGTSFLPKGSVRFEFGVNKQFKTKAADDWAKRTSSKRQATKFIFATPRRWSDGQQWAEDRRAEKKFADVRVIDGDILEGWLQQTPAVHHWISEQLGRRPEKARTSDSWWGKFSAATTPQLPLDLFLAGRDEQAATLKQLLTGSPRAISVRSEWRDDVLAFVHAVDAQAAAEDAETAPLVIVDSAEVFARIAQEPGRVTLVPTFEKADIALATANGHHVVLFVDDSLGSSSRPDVDLPRLDRSASADAFQAAQVEFRDAQRFAAHARRNLKAFVRSISKDPRFARPAWAEPPLADQLARLLLVGTWTTSDADMELLSKLLDKSADEIEALLDHVSGSDPVFRRTGEHWAITSPREAFDMLAPTLAARPTLLDRWIAAATEVLSEPDPVLDLPEDERPYAGIRRLQRQLSPTLRKGVAQGAALLGALGDDFTLPDGTSLAQSAATLVKQLLDAANADATGRGWQELCDVLPLLAEAAPQEFLDALQLDLARPSPTVAILFEESAESAISPLGGFSLHVHLLWAVENICWSTDHLLDGVHALVRLAEIDPGGRTTNRPAASLSTVLCGWVNNTSASHAQRVAAVELVRDLAPDICWKLVLELLPTNHGVSFPPHHPYARRWTPSTSGVHMPDWAAFTGSMVDIGLELVAQVPSRIGRLVEQMGNVAPTDRDKILAELERIASTDTELTAESRLDLWEQLRKTIGRHERFPAAQWSFAADTLTKLRAVACKLEPVDDPKRLAYLFDWHPDVPGIPEDDYVARDHKLEDLREEALSSIATSGLGMDSLALLARQAPVPSHLGFTMAALPTVTFEALLPWLGADDAALTAAASAWVARKLQGEHAASWLKDCLKNPDVRGTARELFLRSVPVVHDFWSVIEERDDDGNFWWSNVYPRFVAAVDIEEIVTKFTAHGRPWAAIEVLSYVTHDQSQDGAAKPPPPSALIIRTLEAAISAESGAADVSSMTSYYIGQLLDALDAADTDEQTMARFEFAFFRLLEHTRQPRVLYTALANEPELFVDLAKRVYRGKNQAAREQDDNATQLANQAWWVLNGWTGFPGRAADGEIDETVLSEWVKTARLLFSESDRADIGDELIGQTFAHAPAGQDSIWPPEPVRDLIELIGSQELENGVILGRFNSRGVTTRGAYEGGEQERDLAKQYRDWSLAVKQKSPRTARILRTLADDYERQARREDVRADINADSDS